MTFSHKSIQNAVVGQNWELIDLVTELLNIYQKHKDECDQVMVVIGPAPYGDYAFEVILETDE